KRASRSRVLCVSCGRAPLSICERYAWLKPRPISLFMAEASSCWVSGRPKPRSEPSTARRERSLSPSFMGDSVILQYANTVLQFVMCQAKSLWLFERTVTNFSRSEEHTSELQSPDHIVC